MRRDNDIFNFKIDWVLVGLFIFLVLAGWLNIFAAVYDPEADQNIFSTNLNSGKQLIWIATTFLLVTAVMVMDFKFYNSFAYIIFGLVIALLIFVLVGGTVTNGSKSWFAVGSFRLQPSEFAKFATALAVAKFMSDGNVKIDKKRNLILVGAIISLPALLIILQNDAGTATVFAAFVIVLYREGLSPAPIIIAIVAVVIFILTLLVNSLYIILALSLVGILLIALGRKTRKRITSIVVGVVIVIGVVVSVDYVFTNMLKPHRQNRIKAFINPEADPLGFGFHVTQSKIAIGSGGFWGKGFLEGTQTKFDFVPEQSTDFIFCTIGEEHGWIGSFVLIAAFIAFMMRIVYIAERQKSRFARIYGYSVVSIIFYHFIINIGMTIGLVPVMGIPLPFFSYGGSSLWSFTILLFILVKLDAHRMQVLKH